MAPERPVRTYCTIRPQRPSRKERRRTEVVPAAVCEEATPRRHSLSGAEDVKTGERDLQAAPVIERMRARPLPSLPTAGGEMSHSPPRKPPRNLSTSRKKSQPAVEDEAPVFEYVVLSQQIEHQQSQVIQSNRIKF